MEKESFEDQEVAEVLNKHFVAIKVDREERLDVDHIYMTVCQALTGHGGWPLSVFLTPDKKPFYAGTYFPKQDHMRMPGFISILNRIINAWENKRDVLLSSSDQIVSVLQEMDPSQSTNDVEAFQFDDQLLREMYNEFKYDFDKTYGGFGGTPKFPTPHNLYFLLRYWYKTKDDFALEMVEKTLDSMYRGGVYDHIGFGFSRYSTDKKWLVPHFEKMLYDNALLSIAYLEAYQVTRNQKYAKVAEEIFTYVLRDMTSPLGGFYSAEDADSEGEEGKFYVWTPDEIKKVLGEADGETYCGYYNITPQGNFEGFNIPNLINSDIPENKTTFIDNCRKKLFETREQRIHPHKDDKILTSWNGLMIAAMAMGGRILGIPRYTEASQKAAAFIFSNMLRSDGRLMARYRDGDTAYPAYAEDYSFLIWGLIELYQTTYNPLYLQKALDFSEDLLKYFWDNETGGLYIYGSDSEQLITRPKEVYDGAIPSGNSVSALNFLRLARLTGRHDLEEKANQQFQTFGSSVMESARGHAFFLSAIMFAISGAKEVVLVDKAYQEVNPMVEIIREDFRPFITSVFYSEVQKDLKDIAPYIESYNLVDEKTTAYVCENYECHTPITDSSELREVLAH